MSTIDLGHVVRLVGVVGDDLVENILLACDVVGAVYHGSLLRIVLRHVRQQITDQGYTLLLGVDGELSHARLGGVHVGTAQLLLRNILARNGLDHLRAGKEHVRRLATHDDEVCQSRRIYRTACAGAEDRRNLRDDARSHDVTLEDVGITGKSVDALLNTCAARVVETDAGSAVVHGHIHDLADLVRH